MRLRQVYGIMHSSKAIHAENSLLNFYILRLTIDL